MYIHIYMYIYMYICIYKQDNKEVNDLAMSAKGLKGPSSLKKEDGEMGALGKLRESLPEIGHDGFKDWEPIFYKLLEKLREHT